MLLFLAILFGVMAAISGAYGFVGLATVFRNIAKILFLVFLVVATVLLILALL
jgi:uncharacterized membrane protein YtjA (UPF0391 family)